MGRGGSELAGGNILARGVGAPAREGATLTLGEEPLGRIEIEPTPTDFSAEEWEEIISEPYDWVEELVEMGWADPPRPEAERFLYGECAQFALALWRRDPKRLRFGVMALADGGNYNPWHVFVHDERYAYDALGRHELPYILTHPYERCDVDLPLSELQPFYKRELADEEAIRAAEEFIAGSELAELVPVRSPRD